MLTVYTARGMTGRKAKDVYFEAKRDKKYLEKHGFVVLDPVAEEGVKPKKQAIKTTYRQLVKFWNRDKEMIRTANVLFDMTPWLKSEGVSHEIAYARYHLWKPVVRVYDPEKNPRPSAGSVAYFEDDLLARDIDHAIYESEKRWGTWYKRVIWRAMVYNRCLIKALWYRLKEWK